MLAVLTLLFSSLSWAGAPGADLMSLEQAQADAAYAQAAHEKRIEAIGFIRELFERPVTDLGAEVKDRLAQMYWAEAAYQHQLEQSAFSDRVRACRSIPDCDVAALQADHTLSRDWASRAARLQQLIVDAYPRWSGIDESRACLARALLLLGDVEAASAQLDQLLREHPDSPSAPAAWLWLGEVQRAQGDVEGARRAYRAATIGGLRDHEEAYARHWLAWCHDHLGEREAAARERANAAAVAATVEPARLREALLHTIAQPPR